MKVLSLFAGIGGFDLGFTLAGWEVVGQVEIDTYCSRILAHHFPAAKRWGDIRNVTGEEIIRSCGPIEVICGGYPCQDISIAGHGVGLDGVRSGLWWEMHRLIREIRPNWVIAENVAAIRTRGIERVVSSLEELDYKVRTYGIRAAATGAPHERKRIWFVANSQFIGRPPRNRVKRNKSSSGIRGFESSINGQMVNAQSKRLESGRQGLFIFPSGPEVQQQQWEEPQTIKSSMGVTANGIPRKLALRAGGNSVIPAIPYLIARAIDRTKNV